MDFQAIVAINVTGLLVEPRIGAELESQAVLGEVANVLRQEPSFWFVRMPDGSEGWIFAEHLIHPVRPSDKFNGERRRVTVPFCPLFTSAQCNEIGTRVTLGVSLLVLTTETTNGRVPVLMPDGSQCWCNRSSLEPVLRTPYSLAEVCNMGLECLGTPYLWGGGTPFGFDCSGLTQCLYRLAGTTLPRNAYLQATAPQGTRLDENAPLHTGDLVFFLGPADPRKRGITHVGIMLDRERVLHASGRYGLQVHTLSSPELAGYYQFKGAWRLQ